MRAIALSRSILIFWEDLVFLEAALLADEETKTLAAPVTALLEEFSGVLKTDLDTRRGVLQAFARAGVADTLLDGGIRKVFSAALYLVSQDRKRSEFTTLFSTHIGDVVRHALKRQLEVAEEIAGKLGLPLYSDSFRAEQREILAPLVDKGKAVLADQHKAELSRMEGRIAIRTWKQDANAVRLSVQGQLTTLAAKTHRNRAWVDTFFLQRSAAATAEEPEETEAEGEAEA